MFSACALLMVAAQADAKTVLVEALEHYSLLKSFSTTIEHTNSSGLFPGTYTQELKWRSDGRFELIVKKKSNFKPSELQMGGLAPNYFANGRFVTSLWPDGRRTEGPLSPDPNTSPGWEVSGGLIMSYLQKTDRMKFFSGTDPSTAPSYSWGPAKEWKGSPVREVVLSLGRGYQAVKVSVFVSQEGRAILGHSVDGAHPGTMRYVNQKENPELPSELGNSPR